MASTLGIVKIQSRKDTLENWTKSNTVLLDGELAIVVEEDGNHQIKIGNGISSFSQLDFLNSKKFETKELITKSISQGYHVDSTPTSMATGIFTKAKGQFGVVHGIEGEILSTDNYVFLYNGVNLPLEGQNFYKSHGEGTFNVNPVGGLGGFYVGENNLEEIYYQKDDVDAIHDSTVSQIFSTADTLSTRSDALIAATNAALASTNANMAVMATQIPECLISAKTYTDQQISSNRDHVLSTAELCGTKLVFKYNRDYSPISVDLSSFTEDYNGKIHVLSDAISTIGQDYLDSNDKTDILNRCIEVDEVTLYRGPGEKEISLSVGTGSQQREYTATLSDFTTHTEVSSTYVSLSSGTTQSLSTNIDMQGFLRVGGITVHGRKFNEITKCLIPLDQQSQSMIGQTYLMISTDFINHYLQGHTYLLTTDISGFMEYKDITDMNEMSVIYDSNREDLRFESHVGSAVYYEEEQNLDIQVLRM